MKTIADLRTLLPSLINLFNEEDHNIGESYLERDEDGICGCNDYASNCFTYDADGWLIEVFYECCGEYESEDGDYWTPSCSRLIRAWGRVTEFYAYHYDEVTAEETEFAKEELAEFYEPFNRELKEIA